ncbi:hypothetical protein Ddc_16446 [Ditylenchus destructor]|nr:hypothetical protein Ddc_16446 [Ditylenchus destructor]
MYEFPKLKHFINCAKSVYRALLEERNFDFTSVAQMINAEVLLEEEATDDCVSKAKGMYEQELKKGALSAFSKLEHEEKLQSALKFLTCRLPEGERRNRLLKDLTIDCTNIWKNGHQRCEAVSLTEHRCSLAVHDLQISHLSGYQLLSTCNCGRSQAVREDPFSAKQANLDFYEQTDAFECCAKLDRIELPVFDLPVLELEGIEEKIVSEESRVPEGMEFEGVIKPRAVRILTKKDSEEEANFIPSISPPLPTRHPLSPPPNLEEESSDLNPIMDRQLASQAYAISFDEFASLPGRESELAQGRRRDDSQATSESESIPDTKEDDESEVAGQARKHSQGSSPELEAESEDDLAKGSEKSVSIGKRAKNESESSRDTQRGKSRLESHYLDSYDVHLTETSKSASTMASKQITGVTSTKFEEIAEKLKGKFLEHTPFTFTNKSQANTNIPRLLPLYSSWSVVCHGSSSVYNHASGLRNQPNFKAGSEYLLPWDVHLTVNGEQWDKDMVEIAPAGLADRQGRARGPRLRQFGDNGMIREKVKLFVGFDYECQRGHRFMVQNPGKALRHRRTNGTLTLDAASLMSSAQPMWMPCTCKREPKQIAQLMHIHVVTPKAPVTVTLSPKVQMDACPEGYFHSGTENEAVDLARAKYYVLRLPFAYIMPQGAIDAQKKTPGMSRDGETWISPGHLLANCIEVKHTPIAQ